MSAPPPRKPMAKSPAWDPELTTPSSNPIVEAVRLAGQRPQTFGHESWDSLGDAMEKKKKEMREDKAMIAAGYGNLQDNCSNPRCGMPMVEPIKYCPCKQDIAYCSKICQKQDRERHSRKCTVRTAKEKQGEVTLDKLQGWQWAPSKGQSKSDLAPGDYVTFGAPLSEKQREEMEKRRDSIKAKEKEQIDQLFVQVEEQMKAASIQRTLPKEEEDRIRALGDARKVLRELEVYRFKKYAEAQTPEESEDHGITKEQLTMVYEAMHRACPQSPRPESEIKATQRVIDFTLELLGEDKINVAGAINIMHRSMNANVKGLTRAGTMQMLRQRLAEVEASKKAAESK